MDYSNGFLFISIAVWIFYFMLLELVFPPIQIGKESKKKKYLRLAKQELKEHPPFAIKPLTEDEKEHIAKRFEHWKSVHLLGPVAVWIITLIIDIAMHQGIKGYCYLITIPEILATFLWIKYTLIRYKKAMAQMDFFEKLEAKIIHKYIVKYPSGHGTGSTHVHYVVSAYKDNDSVIHVFDSRNEISANESENHIDCLIYKGKFAGYGVGEYPISRATK